MELQGISLFLVLILQEIHSLTAATTATENVTVEIAIFYNSSSRYINSILQNANDMFLASRQELKRTPKKTSNVEINIQWLDETEVAGSYTSDNNSFLDKWNNSLQVQGAIFVDINRKSLFLSSLLESSAIPTVGIFQTSEQPRTQESSAYFSRVALPSMKHYAQVIWDVMKKTGRRSLSLVLTADIDGKELEDSMTEIVQLEKWTIKDTLWVVQNKDVGLQVKLESLVSKQADVIVVHSRDTENDVLFQVIQSINISKRESLWILTDITEYGVRDINEIPVGSLRISSKRREPYLDHSLYSNAINDALFLYQVAYEKANEQARCFESDLLLGENCGRPKIQDLANLYLKESFVEGKSSLFAKPSLYETSQTTFKVWNLRKSGINANKWVLVGLRTPTGLALENLMAPNGSTLTVSSVPEPYVMRVPINLYSPWVQVEDPRFDGNGMLYCIGRGQLCYRFKNSSRIIETTFCCYGASIDLLVMIQSELGFRSEIYFTPDGNYGDFDVETKQWNGIVQEVISGRADFAIDLSMDELREKYLDFAHPFIHLALNVLVLKDDQISYEIQWSSWLEPFQYQLWLSIVGFINFILLIIWWIDWKSPYGHVRKLNGGHEGFTLLDSMTYVWGVAFGKDIGAEKTPHSSSARCVSTFYAFFALIVANTYCANLMAFLVQETFQLPISGIRDSKIRHPSLQPPKGFKLGIQQDSQEESYFKFHSADIFREIYHLNLKVNFVKSFADGIQKLKNREIDGLVGDYLSLSQVANKDLNCSFSLAGPNFFNFGLGLAMRKASPWLQDVNQAVLKHQENGTIEAIEKRWFNKKSCDLNPFSELGIMNFSGLFMTVVIVLCFCVLAILVEFLLILMFMKLGNRLGKFGKFVKRFVFNLKKGEEDQVNIKYSLVFSQRTQTWDVSASTETSEKTFQELGFLNDAYFTPGETSFHSALFNTQTEQRFHNNAYFASTKQSMKGKKLREQETANHTTNEYHEMPNGKATYETCKYADASDSSRTKSLKQSGFVVTKL